MDNQEREIEELRQKVRDLEQKVASIKPVFITLANPNAPVSQPAPETLPTQPQDLNIAKEVAELRGRVDELRNQLTQMKADLEARKADREDYARLEERVHALEEKETEPQPVQPAPVAAPAPAPTTVVVVEKPAPAPVVEAPAPAPEPIVEEEPEEDDNKRSIAHRSFREKMLTASREVMEIYNELRNYFESYKDISSRVSFACDSYRGHRKLYSKITVYQKSLKVFFALDMKDYKDTAMPLEDASGVKAYEEVPCFIRVRSELSVKRAKKLIDDMLTKNGFVQKQTPIGTEDYARVIRDEGREEVAEKKRKEAEKASEAPEK